ncbi:hypothetical protein [Rhodococcus chondri]|uniref:Uncharacterized protein n=1 Tax=Rhodococcus chondri TaxID=3065941 RepID=A0ABU7JUK8_9NOCA|nr:hypothetical protein [Rhodococcus sp. CC-R104]MEE2033707.1 hypothetical protein [Rhodococcus sp. CC-R104]
MGVRAVGIYRAWRDSGYIVGGLVADMMGLHAAVWASPPSPRPRRRL